MTHKPALRKLRRDEGAYYVACLALGVLSALWWMSGPAPADRFVVLLLGCCLIAGLGIAALFVWVGSDDS